MSGAEHSGPAGVPKSDPESLALRVQPTPAIRFKRGAIIAISAAGATVLVATAWFALRPTAFHIATLPDDQSSAAKAPTDALNTLPNSYSDVPKLGPPLPGDLGKPILEHQQSLGVQPLGNDPGRARQAAMMERERMAEQLKAARESGLLAQMSNRSEAAIQPLSADPSATSAPDNSGRAPLDPDHDPNAQGRKADFLATRDTGGDTNPGRLIPAASPNLLSAGSVIAGSLITGLRSDLPGLVIAQVTERVFDSPTGSILLIPQGARLIGSYDSVVAFGQRRALIVWQRLIMPNGSSIRLDNVPATDPAGYAGLADKLDAHTWTLLKGAAISTLLGVGSNITFSGESDLVQAIRQSTQQNVSRAGDQLTSRNLQIQPTISIRPGALVRLVVHRDLVLKPWNDGDTR